MKLRILLIFAISLLMNNVMSAQDKGGCDLCGPSGTTQNNAKGNYSATIGMSNITNGANSFAVGQANKTMGAASVAIGKFAWANATNAVVIGAGTDNTDAKALINNYSGTLMVGFNSCKPTLFVGKSNGGSTTGKIGIGNMINPMAKLHLLSDSNEDAGMILETSNKTSKTAFLQLYDDNHKIMVSKEGMQIAAPDDALSIDAGNIKMSGKVGINTDNNFTGEYDYTLAVKGGVLTSEVYVKEVDEWHDYVFDKDYQLMPLDELAHFVSENKHLPDLPSEGEVLGKGYNIAEMDGILLKKIEELTLYIMDLQRQLQAQQEIIDGQRCLVFRYDADGNRISRHVTTNCQETRDVEEVQEMTENEVKVYPNPNNGTFRLIIPDESGYKSSSYEIFDANGILLFEGKIKGDDTEIDIGNVPAGVYLLKVSKGEEVLSRIVLKL